MSPTLVTIGMTTLHASSLHICDVKGQGRCDDHCDRRCHETDFEAERERALGPGLG